jgi:thioredoxin reductase (NADPH)
LPSAPIASRGDSGEYTCDALIIATGASAPVSGVCPSEEAYMGRGISACATCDGFLLQRSAGSWWWGGGNTAVEEALYLSNIADHVTLVHRRDKTEVGEDPAGSPLCPVRKKARSRSSGTINWTKVLGGDAGVSGARLKSTVDNSTQNVDVAGIFIAIGHKPNTDIFCRQTGYGQWLSPGEGRQ